MTYAALEKQIKKMPQQYISEVSKYIDFLMYKNNQNAKKEQRKLGLLKDIATVKFSDDFAMTSEELLNL